MKKVTAEGGMIKTLLKKCLKCKCKRRVGLLGFLKLNIYHGRPQERAKEGQNSMFFNFF